MDRLRDFAQKDMIEQIMLLEEIREGNQQEAISGFLDPYAEPLADWNYLPFSSCLPGKISRLPPC